MADTRTATSAGTRADTVTNGPGAASVLAAALGALTLGVLALLGDAFPRISAALNLWKPTGALSGVTDAAILVWLVAWFLLSRRWAGRSVNMTLLNWTSIALFVAAVLFTFPPTMDMLQGK